jgi:murein DD-endopeptidase MepM/ murein hydrolase activator NlpD
MQTIKLSIVVLLVFLTECSSANNQTELPQAAIRPPETTSPTLTPVSSQTPIPAATVTPTPIQYVIEVSVFHDLNGNEIQDLEEPPIPGAIVEAAELSCTTDVDGLCEIGRFPLGEYRLKIDTSITQVENLDFLFANKDVLNPSDGLLIKLRDNLSVAVPLGQGPFTIPIVEESLDRISYGFGDLQDPDGNSNLIPHEGLDIEIRGEGPQPIYAPITGQAQPTPDGTWGECNHVTIWFKKLGLDVGIGIGHLTEVVIQPNDFVEKGDLIGYIDPSLYSPGWVSCTSHPHIHMNIWGSVPGETWPREGSGLPWQVLPASEWGWLNPENYLPMTGKPLPIFSSVEEAENYQRR